MTQTIEYQKGRELFIVRYEVGEEGCVLDHLITMVKNRTSGFDWFDAAVISHKLDQNLCKELRSYLPKKPPP